MAPAGMSTGTPAGSTPAASPEPASEAFVRRARKQSGAVKHPERNPSGQRNRQAKLADVAVREILFEPRGTIELKGIGRIPTYQLKGRRYGAGAGTGAPHQTAGPG